MQVPFLNIKDAQLEIRSELDAAFQVFIDSGSYLLGPQLQSFEEEFAQYCGTQYCVGVANGLDALHLMLRAYGIGHDDEVIVPSNTYIATWIAVTLAGGIPIPVEPDDKTYNINPELIETAITPKTKAILAVNLYGRMANISRLRELASKHGLLLFEDAAQAHGAKHFGKCSGAECDAAAYSFYPSKNLGALGDGGAIVTASKDIAEKLRILRNYGSKQRYYNEVIGYNSRLDELQAAFLRIKLKKLDTWNRHRVKIAAIYHERLKGIADLTLPAMDSFESHAWHLYVVRTKTRNTLQEYLGQNGIGTLIHYPVPPHLSEAYGFLGYSQGAFPVAESLANEVLSLPMGSHLSIDQANYVADHVLSFYT